MAQTPGVNTHTIADLVPYVQDALQNRADVTQTLASRYLVKALMEISESYPVEELRVTGPTATLTIGQAIYPVTTFLNQFTINNVQQYDDYTQIPSFAVYVDYPTNTVVSPMFYKTPMAIEPMIASATQGLPARWTRYGQNIHIGPTPNAAYAVFMRYQRRYPVPDDETQFPNLEVYLDNSWEEIAYYAAAERIAVIKRWNDQAKYLHDILYGDPLYQTSDGLKGRPGLVAARTHQMERDQQQNSRQIMPLVSRYNSR